MSDKDGFDQHYDVILTGTDLTSSLLSAALARVGKNILHLDKNKYYGKEWRSMKLSDLLLWLLKPETSSNVEADSGVFDVDQTKERLFSCNRPNLFSNIETDFCVFENRTWCQKFVSHLLKTKCSQDFIDRFYEDCFQKLQNVQAFEDGCAIIEQFKDSYPEMNRIDNLFIFDLCPRFLFSNEKMVKILIDSTVTRYIEFKKISRLLTPMMKTTNEQPKEQPPNDEDWETLIEIVEVPCTRSDIFMSDIISPIEKRYLMSFLEKCYRLERNHEWYCDYSQKPFTEFLKSQILTEKLRKFIINTLLMISEPIVTERALEKINFFLRSFGRFCDRPFLFPLYGSEDMIQAFCRYGAVWGGLYCLGVPIRGLIFSHDGKDGSFSSNQRCKAVLVNQSRIECDHLITDYRISELKPQFTGKLLSRAIILNTKSIKAIDPDNGMGDLSFIHLPPEFTGIYSSVYCFESDYSSRVCPRDFYLQYFWCDSRCHTAREDLEPVVKKLFSLSKEAQPSNLPLELQKKILLSVYYNYQMETVEYSKLPKNIKIVSTPDNEMNYEKATNEAETIFHELYPQEEFFPQTENQQNGVTDEYKDLLDDIQI